MEKTDERKQTKKMAEKQYDAKNICIIINMLILAFSVCKLFSSTILELLDDSAWK